MTNRTILKLLEIRTKHFLKQLAYLILPSPNRVKPQPKSIGKILVYRLDQRIGNGLLLLPLLRAIHSTLPEATLVFVIHKPVADFLKRCKLSFVSEIIPYDQPSLMKRPWRMLSFFQHLKKQQFDVAITSHNPDNFSVSQALLGKYLRPRCLIGFEWKDSARFYDVAVKGSTAKHYAAAMVDLWREIDPEAKFMMPRIQLEQGTQLSSNASDEKEILIWLGATGRKKLPVELIAFVYEQLSKNGIARICFGAGPADREYVATLPEWIAERTTMWDKPLTDTALFFSSFSLFISGDTGPMHLAVVLGIPTLTLFVDSNITQYGYNDGERHFAIKWEGTANDRQTINRALHVLLGQVLDK